MNRLNAIFKENTKFKTFLLSILITGLSYGLYKGILDNYLVEVVGMGEMDRGITEFFRELPGIMLIFILAAFYMLSAESLYKMGALIMLVGMGLHAILPPTKVLIILAICIYSLGEHIQFGMKSTIPLEYARPGLSGTALGMQNAANQIGTLAGYVVVVIVFSILAQTQPYRAFFALATVLAAISAACSLRQVFITCGPYGLVLFYGANTATISLLFAISAVACFFAAPVVGKIIDKVGYKAVMVSDTLILVIVCFFYGFAHYIFPRNVAFVVCCVNYVLDAVISLASMASSVYVQALSDDPVEVKATISTGVSVNHVISVFIALFGGWIWQTLGIEMLFIASAILGLCNSAYAASIKT